MTRPTLFAGTVAVVLAGATAASIALYGPTRTAACMRAAGANVDRAPGVVALTFPEIRSAIYWHLSARETISIMFTRNAPDAVRLAWQIRKTTSAFGLTRAEAKTAVKQLGNSVWTNDEVPGPTAAQDALISRCLR